MVANIRCAEIMQAQLQAMQQDQAWLSLQAAAQKGIVPQFGTKVEALIDSCCTGDPVIRPLHAVVQQPVPRAPPEVSCGVYPCI